MSGSAITVFHSQRLMIAPFATFFGVDAGIVLLITTSIATLALGLAISAIVFFAWAPYVSTEWAGEFGAEEPRHETGQEQPAD